MGDGRKKKAAAAGEAGPSSAGLGVFASVMAMPDVAAGVPPEVELARTRVICGPNFNSNVRGLEQQPGRARRWP